MDESRRDRDGEGRARNARPRDGLGRPLPYGSPGVERQPEGVVRSPGETVREAQWLLDAGMPFHAHEVFEDAWKSGPDAERELWRGLAQMAVGLTHAARGNAAGGARLLRRGAVAVEAFRTSDPHGIGVDGLIVWAQGLAGRVDPSGPAAGEGSRRPGGDGAVRAVDAAAEAPRLRREDRAGE
ncbi:DUF309 domain-containing protein [Streptomyces sp. JH34]|uniref:DUF309 domain-containing protein n=1 Tax=Streptomyces sp. JH34 TaxID=2793633 RepID=UPI0023F6895D|nr:DUF309 domain-containing protein [Streptomyces sp. JH34]MDF6017453.1 DUF309 domain-containing protein [Streptomyces sp. JH34]